MTPRPWQHDWHHLRELRDALRPAVDGLLDRLPTGATVLDYGAGDAPYRRWFADRPDVRYMTADLEGNQDLLVRSDGSIPLADSSVQAIVSFQVLEHVADLHLYLAECRRLLGSGGSLLLSTHGAWLYHPHPTDYRRWTRDGLCLELERHGFFVEHVRGVVGPLAWTTQFRLFGYREVLDRLPFLGSWLMPLICLVMNARMVIEEAVTPDRIRQCNACVYIIRARPA